jgi:hypothetical protein
MSYSPPGKTARNLGLPIAVYAAPPTSMPEESGSHTKNERTVAHRTRSPRDHALHANVVRRGDLDGGCGVKMVEIEGDAVGRGEQ